MKEDPLPRPFGTWQYLPAYQAAKMASVAPNRVNVMLSASVAAVYVFERIGMMDPFPRVDALLLSEGRYGQMSGELPSATYVIRAVGLQGRRYRSGRPPGCGSSIRETPGG